MWSQKLVLILVLSCVHLISSSPQRNYRRQQSSKGDCAFGDEYNDGCNHCICHGKAGSTCSRIPNCSDSSTSSPTRQANARGHCSLGQEFRKDCNICTCRGDLGYVCTSKECTTAYRDGDVVVGQGNKDFPLSPTPPPTDTKGKCILGHRFFSGCDLCTCYGEYFGYRCSKMDNCRTPTQRPSTTSRLPYYEKLSENCTQGQSFHDGYYFCTCRKDKLGYVCKSTLSSD